MKNNIFIGILILAFVLIIITDSESFDLQNISSFFILEENKIPNDYGKPIEVYFCPRDNCTYNFTNKIDNAQTSIHCALFDLDNEIIINAFKERAKDIDVKIFMDDGYALNLPFVRKDTKGQLSHNKFCIFDGSTVWTGSYNPTKRGTYLNNNNVIIIDSKSLAINYESEFEELWSGSFGRDKEVNPIIYYNDKKIENYFCPDDPCEEKFLNILNNAEESIYFMTFSFTLNSIGDVLIDKYNLGLDVKGVFERTQNNKYNEFVRLNDSKVPIKWDLNKYKMHHKVFIIDKKIVITGSTNPSKNGCTNNDENMIIIHSEEIASKYLKEFRIVWG